MSSENSIRTIDDYLQLRDWLFELDLQQGSYSGFSWLRSSALVRADIHGLVDLPTEPFRVLVTSWDGLGGGATVYGTSAGWRRLGPFAISSPSKILPKLYFGADNAQMILDEPTSDEDILETMDGFDDPRDLEGLGELETKKFWNCFEMLNPYCYFSYGQWFTLVIRGKEMLDRVLNEVSFDEVESIYKNEASAYRAKLWQSLGPECGPETCIELGCERLRIGLAVRCFLHQLEWGGRLKP